MVLGADFCDWEPIFGMGKGFDKSGFWERFTEGQNAPTLDGEVAKGNRPVCHDTNSGNVYKTLGITTVLNDIHVSDDQAGGSRHDA